MWLPENSHDDTGIFWGVILGWKMSFHYTDGVIFRVVSIGLGLFWLWLSPQIGAPYFSLVQLVHEWLGQLGIILITGP
jgi:hypothetical protein